MYGTNLDVRVECDAANGVVLLAVKDAREEVFTAFAALPESRRSQLAATAWLTGTLAVHHAHGLAVQTQLEEVGSQILAGLDEQLGAWTETTESRLKDLLRVYFDADSGQLGQRIDRLVRDDGELAGLLRTHVAPENSTLARTLAERVGETSPIFKLLDPDQGKGLVSQLEARLKQALDESRLSLGDALNPRIPGSPVSAFLSDLRRDLESAEQTREQQLRMVAAQLDANDDNSLLSQLARRTRESQAELRRALNPEEPGSPLAIVRDTVTRLARESREEQRAMLEAGRQRQEAFEARMLTLLTHDRATRDERARGPRAGRDFEDLVVDFVAGSLIGAPVACEPTGTRPGRLDARKVGDMVVRFTSESAFAGSGLVVEVKQDRSMTVARALSQLQIGRENRGCVAGLLVLAETHSTPAFPTLSRYGQDVLVTWNPDRAESDAYLHAALQLGLALAAREAGTSEGANLTEIADIEERIGNEIRRLEGMEKHCDGIERHVDKLKVEIGVARKKLGVLSNHAHAVLSALDHVRATRAISAAEPVGLLPDSLEVARAATTTSAAK